MLLTIAFITHNRKEELLKAIDSCLSKAPQDTEYVIVDNASTDGTEDYIKGNLNARVNLTYFFSEDNLGVAGGRNKAFQLAKGDYVFFLDDDAKVMTDDFFGSIIKKIDSDDNIVAITPNIQEPELNSNVNTRYRIEKEGEILILSFVGGAHILRKSFYSKFKALYPQKLMFGSEELYASFLAWMKGKKVVQMDDLLVNHYPSKVNRCQGDERNMNFIANQYIIKKMTYPKILLPLSKIVFELHKRKHGLKGKKWKILSRKIVQERFSDDAVVRMSIGCWFKLLRRFGWKIIL